MDETDDFDAYNGNPVHDMWVDYDYYINTGIPDYFDDDCADDCPDD